MRFGVISDVHANLHALEAALAFLSAHEVDGYLCGGDLVGYGPMPNECVRRVCDLPATTVAGNHDLIALGVLGDERCDQRARESLRWTRAVLQDDTRALLSALPREVYVEGVAVHHGSPTDVQEYVRSEAQAQAALNEVAPRRPDAPILVLGHTHHAMAVGRQRGTLLRGGTGTVRLTPGERILLNPGSVGQSRTRDARARVMVLDLADRSAAFHAVAYDTAGCREALRERGLAPDSCHPWRSRWGTVLHAVHRTYSGRHGGST
jgi:predicted phosphodiesterase